MSTEILLLAGGAIVAGFVQGLSGFAFAMVAMSIWVWGVEPRLAAVMTVFGGFTGQLLTAVAVRRGLHLPLLLPFLIGGAAGIPVGALLLPWLDPKDLKLVLGTILVVFCPVMLLSPRLPPLTAGGRIGDALAGFAGGVLGCLGGFTGPVPALWGVLRGYGKLEHRAMLQNFNLAALGASSVALIVSGAATADMIPKFAIVAPAMIVPSLIGARLFAGMATTTFRRLVLALLFLSGLAMLAAGLRPGG